MVYQMNALSFDQLEKLQELCEPLEISVDTYVKETGDRRKQIRNNPPQILLTNPEYLNAAFLGWLELHWKDFLRNLRYFVIDEMHLYHGYFGNNMTLLLRRFFLQLQRLGASPQVFLSSATCACPDKHAEILTGRKVELVQVPKAMQPKRHFLFVKPERTESSSWKDFRIRIEKAALAMLEQNLRVLIFCPTINFIEEAYKNCIRTAEKQGFNTSQLARYHSRLPSAEEKLQTQEKIKSGEHQVIFTTNALEVGLDIGGLDGIVLAGFPSNVMSAWQRIGRAGRNWNSDAFVLFYAMDDPIDNFFVSDIDSFLNKPLDELVVNPANEQLIQNHMDSLMAETNGDIRPDDKRILGHAFYDAAIAAAKEYKPNRRRSSYRRSSPQKRLLDKGLRGDNSGSYDLVIDGEPEPIGRNIPEIWKFRHGYQDAIITVAGKRYRVYGHIDTRKEKKILLEDAPPQQRTEAFFSNYINEDEVFGIREYGTFSIYYGEVNLTTKFRGYRLIDEVTEAELDRSDDDDYYEWSNLHAFWIENDVADKNTIGINSLLHLLRAGALPVVPADRFETSTFLRSLDRDTVFIYENFKGGIGNAIKLFQVWHKALEEGIKRAENCTCETGCTNCIEPPKSWDSNNADVNKAAGIALAKEMLSSYHKTT